MLINKKTRDGISRQPRHRVKEQRANVGKNALAHANTKRPARKPVTANVIGQMDEVRVMNVYRIAADIFIKQQLVSEDKVLEDNEADYQKHKPDNREVKSSP
jgi:hypothetical protein